MLYLLSNASRPVTPSVVISICFSIEIFCLYSSGKSNSSRSNVRQIAGRLVILYCYLCFFYLVSKQFVKKLYPNQQTRYDSYFKRHKIFFSQPLRINIGGK